MSKKIITIKGLTQVFEALFAADQRVKSFRLGDIWMQDQKIDDLPVVLLEFKNSGLQKVTNGGTLNVFTIKLYSLDLIRQDRLNVLDIISNTHAILNDAFIRLNDNDQIRNLGIIVEAGTSTIDHFLIKGNDGLGGSSIEIKLKAPALLCEDLLPIYPISEFGDHCQSCGQSPISQFNCDDLLNCELIQNIITDLNLAITGGTFNNNILTLESVNGNTVNITGFTSGGTGTDIYVTGGTYSNGTATFRNNTGGTFTVTGFTTGDTFVTGATYSNNNFIFTNNLGNSFNVGFNSLTGLTVNGNLSATTYQNLPTDVRVTGGTYSDGTATFRNNTGGTFNVTGFQNWKWYAENGTPPTTSPTASGSGSIALGNNATAASDNMFVYGNNAGFNSSGTQNSNFIGTNSGEYVSTAQHSNFIGTESGRYTSNSSYSNFIGFHSGLNSRNAFLNNFIGFNSGEQAIDINNSNFIGVNAGNRSSHSYYSNFIGVNTGKGTLNSCYSTLIGYQVGSTVSGNYIKDNNIIIGTNITLPNNSCNALNIGATLFGSGLHFSTLSDPYFGVENDGKIGIGVVTPTNTLHISGITNPLRIEGLINSANTEYLVIDPTGIVTKTSGATGTDTFVTGFTYNNANTLTIQQNQGQPVLNTTINTVTGLTSTGTISSSVISATTYSGLGTAIYLNEVSLSGATGTTSSTSYINITGLTATMQANRLYAIELMVMAEVSSTSGSVNISLNGSTPAKYVAMHWSGLQAAGNRNIQDINTYDWTTNMPTGVPTANYVYLSRISALVLNGGSTSTLAGRIRRGGTTGTITIRGSFMKVREI